MSHPHTATAPPARPASALPLLVLTVIGVAILLIQLEGRWSQLARDHLACMAARGSRTSAVTLPSSSSSSLLPLSVMSTAPEAEDGQELAVPKFDSKTLASIYMPEAESRALLEELERVARRTRGRMVYLEYGSGGSTTVFTKYANVAVSVEHDPAWCARVKQRLKRANMTHVNLMCVNKENGISPTAGWDGDYFQYRTYIDSIDRPGLSAKYDFVYIDGRARLAAALKVLPYLRNDSVVVLHDAVRAVYKPVTHFYKVLKFVDSGNVHRNGLKIMQRRADIKQKLPMDEDAIDTTYDEVRDIFKLPRRHPRTAKQSNAASDSAIAANQTSGAAKPRRR